MDEEEVHTAIVKTPVSGVHGSPKDKVVRSRESAKNHKLAPENLVKHVEPTD